MSDESIFACYSAFRAETAALDAPRELLVKEAGELFTEWADRVEIRGVYSTTGFHAEADILFWFISSSMDHVQDLHVAFARTQLGRALRQTHSFLGLVRPAEFAKDHLPAFVKGEEPKKYFTVYPFVRTPEWYLLDPQERGGLLKEHGLAGREFPDVLANTTSAFGLGDFEWILAFEADGLDRIVELLRRLRATEARRYTKVEIPFVTGIRKELDRAILDLP